MKIAVLLLAVLSLTAAKPGGYHHQQYSFEQSSASYRNNELQHKDEEHGRYTKFEDLDSPDKPQESSVYHQSEYNAPGAENVQSGVKGHRRGQQSRQSNVNQRDLFKDSESEQKAIVEPEDKSTAATYSVSENPDEGTTDDADDDADGTTTEATGIESRWGHGGHSHHHGGRTHGYHGHTREYHQGGHRPGGHHPGGGYHHGPGNRQFAWHNPDSTAPSPGGHSHHGGRGYHPWRQPHTSHGSSGRPTGHGSGHDYWANTEGGQTSSTTPASGGRRPDAGSQLGLGTTSTSAGVETTVTPAVPTGTSTADLRDVFGQIDAIAAETGEGQSHWGRGMLDIRAGTLTRPKVHMRMHHDEDLTQQTQDMSQQAQDLTQQTQDLTQQTEDLTQQTQDGFSILEVASQYQQQSNQKHDHLDDMTQQQSQEGFGQLERGSQRSRTLEMPVQRQPAGRERYRTVVQAPTGRGQHVTPEKEWHSTSGMSTADQQQHQQHQLDDLTQQQTSDLTQQHQDGFGTLEVGSQYQQQQQQSQQRSDKLEDLTQQHQLDDLTQQQTSDLTQQHQDGFGTLEVGSQYQQQQQQSQQRSDKLEDLTQQHADLTQQTQDGFSGFEFGSQQHEHMTQQSQDLSQQSQDLTQQSQDLTQHSQDLTQQHEDLTQQTQDGFGKLEFGQQQDGRTRVQHITSENTRPTGRHNSEPGSDKPLFNEEQYHKFMAHSDDLTQQQSNSGFDKIEVEDVTHQHSPKPSGKLEQTQQHEDLTQQTQDGFGTLEVGSQYQQHQSRQRSDKLEDLTQQQQQQSQDGTFEFGSQYQQQSNQNRDKLDQMQQQTQDKLGNLEFGVQHHQDMTQQQEDLTQQHQDGFSTLEIGSQYQQQQQQSQHKSDKIEDLTQQHADLTQQQEDLTQQHQDGFGKLEIGSQYQQSQQKSEDLTQQRADLTQQQEDLTQQTQDGFGTLEIGSQYQQQQHKSDNLEDLTQQQEDLTQQTQDGFGQLELGQQRGIVQNGDWRTRHYQQQHQHSEQRSHSQSSTYSSRQYHQSARHSGQLNYAHVGHTGADETTGELVHESADHQHAQQVEDVSQHVQRVDDIKFDDQKEKLEDFNQRSTQEILAKKHEDGTLQGRDVHHGEGETEKPGFWKRVGSSITSTYESAKEKSKTLADKVKANLG